MNFCINCCNCCKIAADVYKCIIPKGFDPVTGKAAFDYCSVKNYNGDCKDFVFKETWFKKHFDKKLPALQEEHTSSYDIVPTTYKEPWWLPILKKIYEWIAR